MKTIYFSLILTIFFSFNFLNANQQEITIGKIKLKCLVFAPVVKDKILPSLFIFIGHGAGGQNEAQYCFDGAKDFCEKQGLLLVTPISNDNKGFINEKNEIVVKLAKWFISENKVSPKNIFIGGISNGGVAALQIAGSGELPFCSVLAIPGIFYAPLKKTTGFKGLHVYLRIGANDELKWSAEFDKTNQSLIGYGAKVDGKLVEKGGHLFVINWEEVGKWKESIIAK